MGELEANQNAGEPLCARRTWFSQNCPLIDANANGDLDMLSEVGSQDFAQSVGLCIVEDLYDPL